MACGRFRGRRFSLRKAICPQVIRAFPATELTLAVVRYPRWALYAHVHNFRFARDPWSDYDRISQAESPL